MTQEDLRSMYVYIGTIPFGRGHSYSFQDLICGFTVGPQTQPNPFLFFVPRDASGFLDSCKLTPGLQSVLVCFQVLLLMRMEDHPCCCKGQ